MDGPPVTAGYDTFLGRVAGTFVAAVGDGDFSDCLFPVGGATWHVHRDMTMPVAGICALMVQSLHPLAMAGVDQHSQWREDPLGRMAQTTGYLTTITYGNRERAEKAAAAVRRVHATVRGMESGTGTLYDANDPKLLLWVHVAMVMSFLRATSAFGAPMTQKETEAYVREMVVSATLVGVPEKMVPRSVGEMERYLVSIQPSLRATRASKDGIAALMNMEMDDPESAAMWRDLCEAAVSLLPQWALTMHGVNAHEITPSYRQKVRQLLGVLDLNFESEPGVAQARERLLVRSRKSH